MKIALRSFAVLLGIAALAAIAGLSVVAMNLHTYARLTYEKPVAELSFEARGPQRYLATLTRLPSGEVQTFELSGDEWQVDARVLKWHGWANVLGLDARYRLERVSGRYLDIEQERTAKRSVYALGQTPAIDLWKFAQAHPHWVPFLDGFYGSAAYLPMQPGERYRVTLTQSGLIARPVDSTTPASDDGWR
jgi:hypothetical protein